MGIQIENFVEIIVFFFTFSKTLLAGLKDPEQSSAIGASVVLKFFIQQKGSELFHAVPDLVKECLGVSIKFEMSALMRDHIEMKFCKQLDEHY